MSLTKLELKNQLETLGIKIEGNYARIPKRLIKAEDLQKKEYYKANSFTDWNDKKPTIEERKASKKPEGWFETKEEAMSHYSEVQGIAKKRAIEIEKELKDLKKRLGFELGYTMEGDTHGIYEDYLYLEIKVEEYRFIHKLDQDF